MSLWQHTDPQDAHARIHQSVSARLKALGGARVNVGVRGSSPFSVDLSADLNVFNRQQSAGRSQR